MQASHFQTICRLIKAADDGGLLTQPRDLSGLSGEKLIGLIQRLAAYEADLNRGCYLEVGVFQGLSLISAASVLVGVEAFGVDNFSQYDKHGRNFQLVQERMRVNAVSNATVINMDYEDALEGLSGILEGRKIGTFFVDGPHDYRSQLVCLQLVRAHLSDTAVIVVDDCNYRHVRLANRDFLMANAEFKLIFESYTKCHPENMRQDELNGARRGWWNGVNVIVRDLENELDAIYPPTLRDRSLHQNEHLVHAAKYAALAPDAVALLSAIRSFKLVASMKSVLKMLWNSRHSKRQLVGKYLSANTFSEGLPDNHFNPSCQNAREDSGSLQPSACP